ncbi:ATP synthase F1 subunit gamma [Myxococcus sp. MISCRS1]|jgi:F-type H+-transporting ATPase subunit gamma|uniref:ATP synthase F1 subunit gamma n=1 Tax=Myxococcus TaxID=32 RepID=UPI001143D5A8|nr:MULTISPECIES: ATP synthase F1 subunit gamma [Myxococcus]MBZ4396595.1 ATP synthase F1 subunit gamma [Myxococcus sp. AS-1-15]MBZ4411697.1 ATP synthase F1 subunit gamma [Myxococcus sp. XM-1-1-1]MCK8500866.1 ATP synthase F1 subunit gamma [Myxococcus fulvus]MCY1000352.1 ATP synthase F1 subunit gamma [Myxococcus sp. MISCRS1]
MASLRDIRKRIRSVKNTRQITKAMKMVSAAKLRKAQDAILAARPYASMLDQIISDLAARSGDNDLSHPLLAARPVKRVELVTLTSDRGLAGGFNSNVTRRANRFLYENAGLERIQLSTVGRKGNDFFRNRNQNIRKDFGGLYQRLNYRAAADVAEELVASFLNGEVDAVHIVYNEFISAINQKVVVTQLLPLQTLGAGAAPSEGAAAMVDFKYEPDRQAVLDRLVPQAVNIKLYRALLESVASEHGARMSAMENATSNASDMISSLTLTYNRTRQAVITKELMEIVSGAEALK